MLRLVQLQGFEGRRPGQMSGGQQQRVALARVLATRPRLVLLDEPLSALDAKLREELRLELKQILAAVGSTTIVVTHDQDEAMSLADRIVVMNRGRIEQQGTPDEIYMQPRSRLRRGVHRPDQLVPWAHFRRAERRLFPTHDRGGHDAGDPRSRRSRRREAEHLHSAGTDRGDGGRGRRRQIR